MNSCPDFCFDDLLAKSEFLGAVRSFKTSPGESNLFGAKVRRLKPEEIKTLKKQGNRADNWKTILVSRSFSPARVQGNTFFGTCVLGLFKEEVTRAAEGVSLPSGIYDSMIADSEVGNHCLIQDVGLVSRMVVMHGAVVFQPGELSASGECGFGNGRPILVGPETGGREVLSFAELTIPLAEAVAKRRSDAVFLDRYAEFVREYVKTCKLPFGVVEQGAVVRFSGKIHNSYIGQAGIIDGALLIENTTILSSPKESANVASGAVVRNSCIQWGCEVTTGAVVDESVLTEHSHAERHAKVTHSIIGPNSAIGEGEITSCLVGPFVASHHQSLLIAALWPEGKGNVAHGSNIGSNHTSRAPDQEIWCGEGTFFGLGVNIKFPCDFSESPYSIIATGSDTLPPQRVEFPFSLIHHPPEWPQDAPPAYNEILPGWVLSDNMYMLKRNEGKYKKRNKAQRTVFVFDVFRPDTVGKMIQARDRLAAVDQVKLVYAGREIQGLGRNYLKEEKRLEAIETYGYFIEYYVLSGLKRRIDGWIETHSSADIVRLCGEASDDVEWEFQRKLLADEGYCERGLEENLMRLAAMQETIAQATEDSKQKDDARGMKIIEDYSDAHKPAAQDGFVREIRAETETLKREIEALIQKLA
jgi:hypothetical protein